MNLAPPPRESIKEEGMMTIISEYSTEGLVCIVALLYLLAFTFGLRQKRHKRKLFTEMVVPALSEQFFEVRETHGDGLNELACYATGRRGCRSASGRFRLKNSHDLASLVLLDRVFQNEDRFLLSIDFVPEEVTCPFVFAVVHTRALYSFLAFSPDVRAYTHKMPVEYLPKTLVCHTENRECVVLTTRMVQALRQAEGIFRYLHISDQIDLFDLDPPDRGIRLCTRLPESPQEIHVLRELILATCELVDVVDSESIFPTKEARDSAVQARLRVHASLSRFSLPSSSDSFGIVQQFLFRQQQQVERRYTAFPDRPNLHVNVPPPTLLNVSTRIIGGGNQTSLPAQQPLDPLAKKVN